MALVVSASNEQARQMNFIYLFISIKFMTQQSYTISLQRIAYMLIIAVITTYIFIIGKELLAPMVFAILLALMMKPVVAFWERRIKSKVFALVLSFFVVVVPLVSISYFICWRSIDIFSEMPSISKKVEKGLDDTFKWMDKKFHLKRGESQEIVMESLEELQKDGEISPAVNVAPNNSKTHGNGKIIGRSVKVSSAFLTGFFLTLIYTFLLLLYRTAIKKFFLVQFGPQGRPGAARYLRDIQRITQQYLYGVIIVMIILGTLNSIGLWVIGLDYAFFFGFLAAFLAIIPYVGTIIGGTLPFAYALATTDDWWQPVAVVILFLIVQLIEGNFITPKVAGNSVQLNPLASIFILLVGGAIWGIVGMVLALPMLAIVKVTCRYIPFLRPISLLLSSQLYDRESLFDEKFDNEKYRLWGFFSKRSDF